MNAKHLMSTLIAAALLAPPAVGVARSQSMQHVESHVSGRLPRAVRDATERFQDVNQALAAGYVQQHLCVSGQDEGAMGVHVVNPALFDDRLEIDRPEALVYEPRNGRLHLVAVEYITPAAAWEASHPSGTLPDLMGHLFHFIAGPNRYGPASFYELHVWAWKGNPRGSFADWNPQVSCAHWPGSGF